MSDRKATRTLTFNDRCRPVADVAKSPGKGRNRLEADAQAVLPIRPFSAQCRRWLVPWQMAGVAQHSVAGALDPVGPTHPAGAHSFLRFSFKGARQGVSRCFRVAMPEYRADYVVHAKRRCDWADRRRR